MKHGRLIIAALVGAMLITSLAGCGSKGTNNGESGEYQKINLSMAVNGTDTQIDSLVARHFADLVSERSGGNIVIDVFSNDTLAGGNSTKGVEYIAVGGSDLGAYATCVLANLEPKLSVATLPWSFTSYQQAREVIDTTGGEYYAEMLANKGITYLGSFHNGFRQLTNSKHAVTTPEDLKGLKIRVPGSAVYMGVFKALGASPTAMSWSEVFTAIQQGTIDGQENGCSVTKSAKMDEIQDYMTIWNYSYENDLFVANTKVWENLEDNTKELLQQCATESCEWGRDRLEAEEDELIKGFQEEGMQVDILTEDQLQAFKEAVAGVTAELKQSYGEEACAAFAHERNGDGGRLFVRCSGDNSLRCDGVAEAAADGKNLLRVADEQIVQNALLRGVEHGLEGVRVMGACNGNGLGPDCAGPFPKLGKAVDHGSSDLKAARHHARRGRHAGSARGISAERSRR